MIRYYNELLAKEAGYVKEVEDDIPSVNWNFNVLKEYRDRLRQTCIDLGYSFISEEMSMIINALKRNYYWYGGGIIQQSF